MPSPASLRMSIFSLLAACSFVAACGDDDTQAPTSAPPQFTAGTLPEDAIDEHPVMLAIAREVPEFAGFYFNDAGDVVVLTTSASTHGAAAAQVRNYLDMHQTVAGIVTPATARMTSRVVQHSFLELARYRSVLRTHVLGVRGVTALDLNEVDNRIEIGVAPEADVADIRNRIVGLGIPPQTVVVIPVPYAIDANRSLFTHSLLSGHPQGLVEGGWQIVSNGGASCTMGFAARRATNGQPVFVTNSHCTIQEHNGPDGTTF